MPQRGWQQPRCPTVPTCPCSNRAVARLPPSTSLQVASYKLQVCTFWNLQLPTLNFHQGG